MKEFLTSLHFVARANKVVFTSKARLNFNIATLLLPVAFMFSVTVGFSQSNAVSPVSEIPVVKDFEGIKWKSTPALLVTLSEEHNQNLFLLSTPGLQPTDIANYTAYDKLIAYIQADITSGQKLEEIAVSNFQRVVDEAPADPVIKYLHVGSLRNAFNQLIEKMALPNTPTPFNH